MMCRINIAANQDNEMSLAGCRSNVLAKAVLMHVFGWGELRGDGGRGGALKGVVVALFA